MVIEKSANQLWRESQTTLSFKDWLTREKKKYEGGARTTIMINKPLNEKIEETLSFTGVGLVAGKVLKDNIDKKKKKPMPPKKSTFGTTLGVNNVIWVVAGVAVGGLIVYLIINKKK